MYWASPWRRECGWEESLVPEGFYNLTSSSWNTEVTSGGHLAQLAAQSKQSQLQVRSAMCPTLPWDGESLTVSSDTSHHPGNRYLLFPGVHPNPPKLQCVAMGSCDLSPGTVGRSSPDFSAALCGSPEPFFTPLTDPFQLPSVPVDMKHPKIMNYSSCALTEEEKNKDLPPAGNGLSHKMWFTLLAVRALWITWHWVQTSPACARSSASRESQALLAEQLSHSEAVLGGPRNDTRCESRWGGSEPLPTHSQGSSVSSFKSRCGDTGTAIPQS